MTPPFHTVSIRSSDLRVSVSEQGAELIELQDRNGLNLLWDGNPEFWTGRSPLLFPIIGSTKRSSIKVGGTDYPITRHGFARTSIFDLVNLQKQSCRWQLRANVATRACYPFEFSLDVTYELCAATLTVLARVSNEDRAAMPVSFGFHPALRWPLPYHRSREDHEVRFEVGEPAPTRRLKGGLLARATHDTPIYDKRLRLHDDLFLDDVLILDRVVSRKIQYGATKGPSIELAFPEMPHLAIWSRPRAGFVCIEPWQGFAAPEDFDGELKDKPGNVILQPGSTRSFCMTLSLVGV